MYVEWQKKSVLNEEKMTLLEYLTSNMDEEGSIINYIEDSDDGLVYITTTEGNIFTIDEESGEVNFANTTKKAKIEVKNLIATSRTSNSITLKTLAIYSADATYTYYYKLSTDSEYTVFEENTTSKTVTKTGLKSDKSYDFRVVATKDGKTSDAMCTATTGTVTSLTQANVTFTYSTTDLTNGNVTVTADTTVTGFTLQTSIDGVNWQDTPSQTFTENGTMYVVLTDGLNYGGSATSSVINIDKTKPVIENITSTTSQITVTATDVGSSVAGYAVTTGDTAPSANAFQSSDTFTKLTQGTQYYVWAIDSAGNISESVQTTTKNVTNLSSANVTFTYSTKEWTTENVTVTASTEITGFTMQVSNDGTNFTDGSSKEFSLNGTMYVRLTDGTNYGASATSNVTNIDKTAPTIGTVTTTSSEITVSATDVGSGIAGYAITTTNSEPNASSYQTSNVFTEKDQNTTYYVWVKDKVGYVSESKSAVTKSVSNLNSTNVTFTYSTENWTNGNVTITASTEITGFTMQVSTDGTNFSNGTSKEFSSNGTMYVRLTDGKNYGGSASGNVTNIDKTAPTISSATTTSSKVTVTASDEENGSGIAGYAITTTNSAPSASSYQTSNVFTGKAQNTTYYVWVKDTAGNVSASTSALTQTITTPTTSNLYVSSTVWSTTNATVTFTTTTDYTIQVSTDASNWTTASSATVTSGDYVYARLTDGTNATTTYMTANPILSYSISYELNSGSYGTYHPTTASYNQAVQISNPTRSGYVFAGWTASNLSTGTAKYGSNSSTTSSWSSTGTKPTSTYFKNLRNTNGSTVTLTANWNQVYTITYNANGGTVSPSTQSGVSGTGITMPTPTYSGKIFDGWYTSATGGSQVTYTSIPSSNVTVYAHWSIPVTTFEFEEWTLDDWTLEEWSL